MKGFFLHWAIHILLMKSFIWGNEFKRGRTSSEEAPRSGGLKTAHIQEVIDKARIWFWPIDQ